MNKKLTWSLAAIAFATAAAALETATPPNRLAPTQDHAQTAYLSSQLLARYHYKEVPLDDALSEKIFERYFKSLDPERLFFTQADIDAFADARTTLDDAILQGNLGVPFAIFQRFEQRVLERLTQAREVLAGSFDFNVKESYGYSRDKAPWPKDDAEARDLWRKRVKNDWLRLKLAGKDDKAIRETLGKRYDNYLARATRNTTVVWSDRYRPAAARRGRADIRITDVTIPDPPALLVPAADADFFLSPTRDVLIFSMSGSGADGIYRLTL